MKFRPFNIDSNDNSLFVTEQCNNNCLMCSQPPRKVDDIEKLFDENLLRIKDAPKDLPIIGITGGEPTLLGDKLFVLIQSIREKLPNTKIHMLTNGRRFSDAEFAKELVCVGGDSLVLGVPLHSDYERDHDIIAGSKGAYQETMLGLYNIGAVGICIELRIVMNLLNYKRFLPMAKFIHKNLPFVGWTAFMGMEFVGAAIKHSSKVWIEPKDYIENLTDAVDYLSGWNYYVDIYNIPLCLLPPKYHVFARRSISDWKNKFAEDCNICSAKNECCGLFSTSKRIYQGLKAI